MLEDKYWRTNDTSHPPSCFILSFTLMTSHTQQKTHNLFRVDENSREQCCAAHIVQCCQQYCSALLSLN